MDDPTQSGGVVMDNSAGGQSNSPPPDVLYTQAPEPQVQQTDQPDQPFVVPASPSSNVNPFIPQVPQDTGASYATVPNPNGGGGSAMKRILMLFILLIVVVVAVMGAKSLLSPKSSDTGTGGVTGLGGPKNTTLVYWGLWENDATLQAILRDFESSHPGVKVEYTKQSPKQYRERLQAYITKGDGPDVFRFHNTWVPMLRNELSPAPSSVMSATEFSTTFYPVANADLVGGDAVYGIPIMIDGLGLYYNEDLFTAAGVTPPVTWEDVLNVVPRLTVKRDNTIITSAIALGTTGNVEHFSDIFATMMMQNGAKLSNPTGQQAEEALSFYKKFSNPADPVYTWNESMDNSVYAFSSGKVAMILAPSWRVFDIKQINPALRFKVIPIPQLPGNTVTWASYWVEGVSSKSKNASKAWELVKYMTNRDTVTKLYTEASKTRLFGEPYARMDMGSSISEDPYVGAYIKQAPTAKSFPLSSRTFDNGINDKLIKYVEDAINSLAQGTAPSGALDTAANGFRQVLGSYGLTTGAAPTTTP